MPSPLETDQIEAMKAVNAMRNNNTKDFNAVIDSAFARPGGVERMIKILAGELAQATP